MRVAAIEGMVRRRILLNYRVAADVARAVLPSNFEPKLFKGYAVAGICLIRLEQIRPKGLPVFFGVSSENSAHRVAVEWEGDDGTIREGVFVSRRDTNSRFNSLAGGRLFPGVHHFSKFDVSDQGGQISLRAIARDVTDPLVDIEAVETSDFPEASLFDSLSESSTFFERGCVGYSSRPDSCRLDGMLLKVPDWQVSPLAVHRVRSAYYDDRSIFPEGSIQFDHALLMRDILHEWHSEQEIVGE